MPKILDRLVSQLEAKWKTKKVAYAIAVSALQRSWNLKKWTTKATSKWIKRWKMTPSQRAKDRAVKYNWWKTSDYIYNKKTNTTKKKK